MKPIEIGCQNLHHLALVLALGLGLGAVSAQAQAILEVGGAGTIGVTTLTTASGVSKVPTGANWTAAGGGLNRYSRLISPPVVVGASGAVTLKFTHRYNFEAGYDGGAVYVSVNGAPPVYLGEAAFFANPYVSNTTALGSNVFTGGEKVFTNQSAGYGTPTLIESIASLGSLNAGDTVSVEFRGGWDDNTFPATTNWEIGAVEITNSASTAVLNVNFTAQGTSGFTVVSDAGLEGPWVNLKPTSVFEINADLLTADRYAPTTPGGNIDFNGANVKVSLLTGTLNAGETFTLFDLSGGTTLSGTPGTIGLPPGTWDTSNLAVNGTIVCVLPKPPFVAPTPPPVTAGMKVWVSGDGVNDSDPTQVRIAGGDTFVTLWKDHSGNGKNATNGTANDQPKYVANGLNGKPVLRFAQDNEDNGDRMYLGDLSADFPTAGSVFVVATIDGDSRYNLFGNRGNNDERWVADTWGESRPGSFRVGRSQSANFTMSDWPKTGSHVFALESSSSVFKLLVDGASIGTDTPAYNSGSGVNWTIGNRATNGQQLRGDIAEFILFDRILSPLEASQVGGYLMQKYGLNTAYPPLNLTVSLTSPPNTQAYPSGTAIDASATVAAGSVSGGTAPYIVQFWVDGALAGTATSEDPYLFDLGALSNGSHQIYAKVTDSTSPTPLTAISATHSFTVAPAIATTTTLVSSANPSTYGGATVTATVVANNASTLTGGTVQFYDGFYPGAPVPVDTATGKATYSINKLGAGSTQITAEYSGHGVYEASSAAPLEQVVNKAPLTVTATNVFRPTGTANPDPLPYKITGYQNGETSNLSGVFGSPLLTTAATIASPAGNYDITCALGGLEANNYSFTLVNGILTVAEVPDTFSVNFFVGPDWPYGGLTTDEQKANVKVDVGMPAGLGGWFTSGWLNYLVPWAPAAPQTPVTLTSNRGSTATFTLNDCRNGWTYNGARTTLLGDGNANMMDAHVNSTLDPGDGSNLFKMEMSNIPFAIYDVIFYIGVTQAQFGDGKGKIVFNGGPERAFTLKSGAFDGTFTEMVDATTPGNYIVFKGVTGSTFTTQTWGTGTVGTTPGFVHLGPTGFQIRAAVPYDTWANGTFANGATLSDKNPASDPDGDGKTNQEEFAFGLDPTTGSSVNPISQQLNKATGIFKYTRTKDSGLTYIYQSSTTLSDPWDVYTPVSAVSNNATPVEELTVTVPSSLLTAPKLFLRVKAQ